MEMYENSISETSRKICVYPGIYCSVTVCSNLPLLRLKECFHNLCWECIPKGLLSGEICENECQRCPVLNCQNYFPLDCLKYRVKQLLSSMQLVSVRIRLCDHKMCISCFEKYILEVENRRQTRYIDLPMEMKKCHQSFCDKEIPTTCLNAMNMAIKGDPIAVAMYLQIPKGIGKCSSCDSEEVFIELAICNHNACKPCTMKIYGNSNEYGLATCSVSLCSQRVPALCLKAVLDDPGILKNNINYFEELTKKNENTLKVLEIPNDCSNTCKRDTLEGRSSKYTEADRMNHLLCPSYGERLNCSYCQTKAVIKFSQCSHGWCLRCLKFLVRTEKDDKLHCNKCLSCGSLGNAKRFIRNCENDGLLVPSYLKPVSGSTPCVLCKKTEAILEEIDCGHRFCDSCLSLCITLQLMILKCPVLGCQCIENYKGNREEDERSSMIEKLKCACCLRKEAVKEMKCGHASCKDCAQRIFPCQIIKCDSFIDSSSSEFLAKRLYTEKDTLFISQQMKPRSDCCVCSGDQIGSKIEQVWQIRRCNHTICKSCFTKLLEKSKGTGIATCPSRDCVELFFTPKTTLPNDLDNKLQMEEKHIGSKASKENQQSAVILYKREASSNGVREYGRKVMTYSFQCSKVEEQSVKQNGLPNLGLTCYKNSVFQVLAETPSFFTKIRDMNKQREENWTFTLCEILWRVLTESSSKTDIEDWLIRFQAEFASIDTLFLEYAQHDSLSFLTSVLSGIAEEAQKEKKEGSVIDPTGIFRGELHDQYTCCKCKKKEYHGESSFFSLPLPTVENNDPKIGECLYQFLASETLTDIFPCSFCKHHTVRKEIQIKKYPDVLVLQLGMISENRERFERVHRNPKFWENFAGLSNSIHLSKVKKPEFLKYKLYGVIVHIGGLTGGHYYAYVKKIQSGKWECRDDSYVRKVGLTEVLQSDAYILFYHKIKPHK
ncbi:uncharacterized protein LOC134235516 isoform X2 [Saccostrea cucullata]|uniref:uncharacterized protein LOC134235516 isoform X2 n=1 Tax=Saccostrea cuccullata TaxID=36930 RepID=UPI002ED4D2AD